MGYLVSPYSYANGTSGLPVTMVSFICILHTYIFQRKEEKYRLFTDITFLPKHNVYIENQLEISNNVL